MVHRNSSSISFSEVLRRTLTLLRLKWESICIAALSFSMIAAVISVTIQMRVTRIEEQLSLQSKISLEQLDTEIAHRLSTFSDADTLRLGDRLWKNADTLFMRTNAMPVLTKEDAAFSYIVEAGPWLFLSFVLQCVIFFLAIIFFLLLAIGGPHSAYHAVQRFPKMILLMIGLLFWMLIRSLLWIPFLGVIFAAYLLPRFAFAPVILASGQSGILPSLSESLRRTKGLWIRIVFNSFLCFLLCLLALWFALLFVVAVALFSAKISFFLWLYFLMLVAAFLMFFLTMMVAMTE